MNGFEAALPALAAAGLAIATLAATAAKACYDFSRSELEVYCRRRGQLELFGDILDDYEQVARAAEVLQIIGTVVFLTAVGWWAEASSRPEAGGWWLLAALGVGFLLLLVGTAWLPWSVARLCATPFLYHVWRPLWLVAMLLAPLAWGVRVLEAPLSRLVGRQHVADDEEEEFEDEIRSIVAEGLHDGVLAPDAREMIEGVIDLADGDVMDIMTPRSNVDAIDVDMQWPDVLDFVVESGRTRYPVYEEKLDHIIGVLYVKDLLPEWKTGHRPHLRDVLRKPSFVPTSKPLNAMLREFLRTRSHLAIVVDEYESLAGVVTIEDVLEEIVGEIVDESDKEQETEVRWIDDASAEVLGATHLFTINEKFGLELDDPDDYDTVAGLVISRLGRLPSVGETVEVEGARITVVEATRRRVERVRIELDEKSMDA